MNKIIKLPKNISDKIAAGEVVTGPVSVVKELVENSIDAGADSIIVEIKNGGRTYIRVTDNGSGIPADEVEVALLPHATSKIQNEEDLDSIKTLGFRGEALTSIAAVSKLEMITMTEGERTGISLYIEGGDILEKKDTGANKGTTIIVKDIFYNTPARLKFMKTDRAESTKIIDLISRIAIAYPNIKIRLVNNDNILFSTTGKGDIRNNIFQIYGTETKENLMEVIEKTDDYEIQAYISPSSHTKKTRRGQIYFVNGRVVSSKTIENAISRGYEAFLFEGRYPTAYVFLTVSPDKLDVNVHPAKTEVRFHNQQSLNDFISISIYNRLKTTDAIPDIALSKHHRDSNKNAFKVQSGESNKELSDEISKSENNNKKVEIEQVNIKTLLSSTDQQLRNNENLVNEPKSQEYESENPVKIDSHSENEEANDKISIIGTDSNYDNNLKVRTDSNDNINPDNYSSEDDKKEVGGVDSNYNKVAINGTDSHNKKEISGTDSDYNNKSIRSSGPDIRYLNVLGSIFATYILATEEDMFYIIDQHAAHERINYELFLKQFHDSDKLSQQILAPLIINVSAEAMNNMESWIQFINKLGYETEIFGDKAIIAKAVPAFLSFIEAENMLKDILDNTENGIPQNEKAIEKLIQRSCKSSVKANDLLKPAEIQALLNDLSKCQNPYSCPHGRPIFVKLSRYDVEKLFRRV